MFCKFEITTNQLHKIIAMVSTDKITEIFCMADDFCRFFDAMMEKYDVANLKDGYNIVNGEEIFYISNPALGLWINREKF